MPMLNCDAVMRQLWDYLDEELTPDRMDAIREHLSMCARCYPQYEFEQAFLQTVAQARMEHTHPAELRSRVLQVLHGAGFQAA